MQCTAVNLDCMVKVSVLLRTHILYPRGPLSGNPTFRDAPEFDPHIVRAPKGLDSLQGGGNLGTVDHAFGHYSFIFIFYFPALPVLHACPTARWLLAGPRSRTGQLGETGTVPGDPACIGLTSMGGLRQVGRVTLMTPEAGVNQ